MAYPKLIPPIFEPTRGIFCSNVISTGKVKTLVLQWYSDIPTVRFKSSKNLFLIDFARKFAFKCLLLSFVTNPSCLLCCLYYFFRVNFPCRAQFYKFSWSYLAIHRIDINLRWAVQSYPIWVSTKFRVELFCPIWAWAKI